MTSKSGFFVTPGVKGLRGPYVAPEIDVFITDKLPAFANVVIISEYTNQPTGYLEVTSNAAANAVVVNPTGNVTLDANGNHYGSNITFDYSIDDVSVTANILNQAGGVLYDTVTTVVEGITMTITPSIGQYYSNVSFAISSNIPDADAVLDYELVSDGNIEGYFTESLTGNTLINGGNGTVTFTYDRTFDYDSNANIEFYLKLTDPRTNNIVKTSSNLVIEQNALSNTFFIDDGYDVPASNQLPWNSITELANGDRLHQAPVAETGDIFKRKYVLANVTVGDAPEHIQVHMLAVGGGGAGGLGLSYPYKFSSPTQDYVIGAGGGGGGGGVDDVTVTAETFCANITASTGRMVAQTGYRGIAQWTGNIVNGANLAADIASNIYVRNAVHSIVSEGRDSNVSVTDLFQNTTRLATGRGGQTSYDLATADGDGCGAGAGFLADNTVRASGTVGSSYDGGARLLNSVANGDTYYAGGGGGGGEAGENYSTTALVGANGGDGYLSDITGANVRYGAGGGSGQTTTPGGLGTNGEGLGGNINGGDGGGSVTSPGENGVDFYGSGGGGASARFLEESGTVPDPEQADGGQGGDGVVFVRYPYRFRRITVT